MQIVNNYLTVIKIISMRGALLFGVLVVSQIYADESPPLRGPPSVVEPILLTSFLPASMQVITHLTDLMKYEIRPSGTTTTTMKPTPHHRPGVFSPEDPPGPAAYFARRNAYQEYVDKLRSPSHSYFHRYKIDGERDAKDLSVDLDLIDERPLEILKQINRIEDLDFVDDDERVVKFFDNYDDLYLRKYSVGKKKIPPTRAYVTLLSLYDMLNKESKKLQLNKYGGYTQEVLQVLIATSRKTSADQLETILNNVVNRRDVNDGQVIDKIKTLIKDLEQSDSYINLALKEIPPLEFSP